MLGNKLKILREKSGLSQKKLSEILHVSQQTVGSWEVNRTVPNPEMMKKIAEYFEISMDYLLDFEKQRTSPNTESSVDSDKPLKVTENDLKVALFGGDGEVTDEMWEEVKRFAEFVKQNKGKK